MWIFIHYLESSVFPKYENIYRKAGEVNWQSITQKNKPVHINAYYRFRLNHWKHISEHWRSLPNR